MYSIEELLSLRAEEKIKIADMLYESVEEETYITNERFAEMDKERGEIESGAVKGYSLEESLSQLKILKEQYREHDL